MNLKSICVYCGSSPGILPEYIAAATQFGRLLALRGIELVFGGGNVGLMGAVADGALDAGGRVTGVIPRRLLEKEVAHKNLTELRCGFLDARAEDDDGRPVGRLCGFAGRYRHA